MTQAVSTGTCQDTRSNACQGANGATSSSLEQIIATDVFVTFFPDGCLKPDDMKMCQREKWVPIAALRQNGEVIIPCFRDPLLARKFGKRNFPKDWLEGVIALSAAEVKWMIDKGWRLELMTYPRVMKDLEGFGYEILEFQSEPDLHLKRPSY